MFCALLSTRPRAAPSSPFGSWLLGSADQSPGALRVRVQTLLTVILVSTNLVGAGVVGVLSLVVIPRPGPSDQTLRVLAVAGPVYIGAAVVLGAVLGTARALRSLRWAVEGRSPSPRDREAALRVPWQLTRVQASLWVLATVLFTALAVWIQPARALSTGFTVGIAGLVVCAIAYLLTEFALRPVVARALGEGLDPDAPAFGVSRRMVVFWLLGTGAPVSGLVVEAVLVLSGATVSRTRLAVVVLVLSAITLAFGLVVTLLHARAVIAPITSVRRALLRVQEGEFETQVPVFDGTELGMLQSGFNRMSQGLLEREHIRDQFGKHVGQQVARAASQGAVELGGESRVVSVLFVDLVGSTTYAARRPAAEVVEVLNRFFTVVVDEVDRHGGLVNKFMGDAALAIFGAPMDSEDHAGAALEAARAVRRRLAEEVTDLAAGIGVATGEAVAGNVGARSRFEYTVIGDVVNAAARITELAKEEPGLLLATWDSVEAAGAAQAAHWAPAGSVVLRGRTAETELARPTDPSR
jgi:adenylate cyclase